MRATVGIANRGEHRASGAQHGRRQRGAGRADAVDQDAANDRQRNVGQAEHRVERADLLLAEATLVAQQLGDRGNRVVRLALLWQK